MLGEYIWSQRLKDLSSHTALIHTEHGPEHGMGWRGVGRDRLGGGELQGIDGVMRREQNGREKSVQRF